MLELRTFGGLSVEANGAPATGAAVQRKTLALLALLAAAGKKGLSRDKITAYLWAESDTERGRNLLNQACYALRRDLRAPDLFLGTTALRLNPEAITSDVQAFEAPSSTIDAGVTEGDAIPIEERAAEEETTLDGRAIAPAGIAAYNPAFDVTPPGVVSGYITDRGVVQPPFAD